MNPKDIRIEHAPESTTAARKGRGVSWAANLAQVLGNGAEWAYLGEVEELEHADGTCACGHAGLKYLFTLHHPDGRTARVGSTCITTYPGVSQDLVARMQADLERLQQEAAERIKKARVASQDAEVQALLAQWSALEWACDEAAQAWVGEHPRAYQPLVVYRRSAGASYRLRDRTPDQVNPLCRLPALKTPRGQAARLRLAIDRATVELAEIKKARPIRTRWA